MPKSYEDEIRDLLKGMDRFPGEGGRRVPPRRPRPSLNMHGLLRIDPQRMMGGALILVLVSYILQGRWLGNYPLLAVAGGYVGLLSLVMFVLAIILYMRSRGGLGMGSGGYGRRDVRWRGQVIQLRPRGGGIGARWRSFLRRFQRRPRPQDPRGRDSFQW